MDTNNNIITKRSNVETSSLPVDLLVMDQLKLPSECEVEDAMFDKFCDPNKPVVVGLDRVQQAVEAIKGGVVETPLTVS